MAADPFPSLLRQHLQNSLDAGLPFDTAWTSAIRDVPSGVGEWPMEFMRAVFGRVYNGDRLLGDATVLEPPSAKLINRVPVTLEDHRSTRCRSGDGCDHEQLAGRHFCAEHQAELDRIRDLAA